MKNKAKKNDPEKTKRKHTKIKFVSNTTFLEPRLIAKNVRLQNVNLLTHCVTNWATIIDWYLK